MYPAGARLVAQAIQDEQLRDAERQRRPHSTPAPDRPQRRDHWAAMLNLARLRVADAQG